MLGRLCLVWGVRPQAAAAPGGEHDVQQRHAVKTARECGFASKGDLVAIVSASPGKRAGATDTVRVVRA